MESSLKKIAGDKPAYSTAILKFLEKLEAIKKCDAIMHKKDNTGLYSMNQVRDTFGTGEIAIHSVVTSFFCFLASFYTIPDLLVSKVFAVAQKINLLNFDTHLKIHMFFFC